MDLSLKHWASKGLNYIQDIFKETQLLSFPQTQQKYNLPHTEYFTYTRVKHYISQLDTPRYTLPHNLWTYLINPTSKTKGISLFYNAFHQKRVFTKSNSTTQLWIYVGDATRLKETYSTSFGVVPPYKHIGK